MFLQKIRKKKLNLMKLQIFFQKKCTQKKAKEKKKTRSWAGSKKNKRPFLILVRLHTCQPETLQSRKPKDSEQWSKKKQNHGRQQMNNDKGEGENVFGKSLTLCKEHYLQ